MYTKLLILSAVKQIDTTGVTLHKVCAGVFVCALGYILEPCHGVGGSNRGKDLSSNTSNRNKVEIQRVRNSESQD